jgi:acetyl-CoA carboxylase carboxyl transferase subunit beta
MAMADSETTNPAPPRANAPRLAVPIAPGVRGAFAKRETPENLWVKWPRHRGDDLPARPRRAFWVTPSGHHMRSAPRPACASTFDDGRYEPHRLAHRHVDDPLKFPDERPYAERLKSSRKATGEQDSMAIAVGEIHGQTAVVVVQDFGLHGRIAGHGGRRDLRESGRWKPSRREVPLVIFTASGGRGCRKGRCP